MRFLLRLRLQLLRSENFAEELPLTLEMNLLRSRSSLLCPPALNRIETDHCGKYRIFVKFFFLREPEDVFPRGLVGCVHCRGCFALLNTISRNPSDILIDTTRLQMPAMSPSFVRSRSQPGPISLLSLLMAAERSFNKLSRRRLLR